jgi:hypothetical protein
MACSLIFKSALAVIKAILVQGDRALNSLITSNPTASVRLLSKNINMGNLSSWTAASSKLNAQDTEKLFRVQINVNKLHKSFSSTTISMSITTLINPCNNSAYKIDKANFLAEGKYFLQTGTLLPKPVRSSHYFFTLADVVNGSNR